MNRGKYASEYLKYHEKLAKEHRGIDEYNDYEKNIVYSAFLKGMAKERQLQEGKSKCNKHIVNTCACCGSSNLFKFRLEHIKCRDCNTQFEHGC